MKRGKKFYIYFIFGVWIVLLALPKDFVNLTLSIPLPGDGRVSIIDFYLLLLSTAVFWGRTNDRYTNSAVKFFTGVVYFLATWSIAVGIIRGVELRNLGLDIRSFLGFMAGLGIAKFVYQLDIKKRTYLYSVVGILMLGISVILHLSLSTQMATSAIGYYYTNSPDWELRVTESGAYSIFLISGFFLIYFPTLATWNSKKKINWLIAIFLSLQSVVVVLNGIRSIAILLALIWALSFYVVYGIRSSLQFLGIIIIFVGISFASFHFLSDILYGWDLFFEGTIERFLGISHALSLGGGRMDEIIGVSKELDVADILFGRGLGGTVRNYVSFHPPYILSTHVAILMWLWKYGVVGVVLFLSGLYSTLRIFFFIGRRKQADLSINNIAVKISAAGILAWILLTMMSGGLGRWFMVILAIFAVDIYRFWLMRKEYVSTHSVNRNTLVQPGSVSERHNRISSETRLSKH